MSALYKTALVVSIVIYTAVYSRGHSDTEPIDGLSESPFSGVNQFLLSAELEAWRDGVYVDNITNADMEAIVATLLDRFGCSSGRSGQLGLGESSALCEECTIEMCEHTYHLVDSHGSISEEQFNEASLIFFHLLAMGSIDATCDKSRWLQSTDEYLHAILNTNGTSSALTEDELGYLLDMMTPNYSPESVSKCFTAESVFEDSVSERPAGASPTEVYGVTATITSYLLYGYCIGTPSEVDPQAFVEDIFGMYGNEGVISEAGFDEMLATLTIGGHEHVHTHEKRSISTTVNNRIRRQLGDPYEEPSIDNVSVTCFTGEDLLDIHHIDHEAGINNREFVNLCPALVQQILRESCQESSPTAKSDISPKVWIYGTISVFIISLGAIVGGLLIPFLSKYVYEKFIHCMISLAVAVLVGDAVIHLLPIAIGVHLHEGGEADHSPLGPELAYAWKGLACVLAVYLFYLIETLMGWWAGHNHAHHDDFDPKQESEQPMDTIPRSLSQAPLAELEGADLSAITHPPSNDRSFFKKYGPLPLMIVFGDALHNIGDGLAIGASFSIGVGPGLSTSLAVFCHEIPHELGDLAILLKTGLKLRTALFLNFLSALTAFAGLYVGIVVATTEVARQWIFAFTAGMFLYVALADMVPQITNIKCTKDPKLTFALQNISFLTGTAFIFLLALYEDAITVSI